MSLYKMPDANQTLDTVIVANGAFPNNHIPLSILRNAKQIIACDGAANTLIEKDIIPNAIVGDCDSLADHIKNQFNDIIFKNPDQETNDLSKAVLFCMNNGIQKISILGATGKRDDHMIANISLLELYNKDIEVEMISDFGCFNAIDSEAIFESYAGQQVSLFSLDESPMTCINLLYPIQNRTFTRWWQATLNECISDHFVVKPTGSVIVYRVFEENKDVVI